MARLAEKQALGVILNKYTCNATSRTPVPCPLVSHRLLFCKCNPSAVARRNRTRAT